MNVRNCARCGRMFNFVANEQICPNCKKKEEDSFQKVKEYIRDNPNCGLKQVSDECEVSAKLIKQWIKEERLEFSGGGGITLNCESCGAPISTGRFCDKCKAAMMTGLKDTAKSMAPKPAPQAAPKKDDKGGMRFIRT